MTKIIHCNCKHDYQDAKYGKGQRVHNATPKNKFNKEWRCTVCGDTK